MIYLKGDKMCKTMKINIPSVATKQLRLQSCSAGTKLTISTNWLPLFGFNGEDTRVVEELIGKGKGIRVRLATPSDEKTKKVYTRKYNSRKNNPLETQLDIRSQRLINEAFGFDVKNVHVLFKADELVNFYHSVGFIEASREIIKKDVYVNMSLSIKDK